MAEITNIMNGKNGGQQDKCAALQKKKLHPDKWLCQLES